MSAYETIFEGMGYITCILAGLGMLSLVLQKKAIFARSILFSFQFWIAPLFYFTYMAIVQRASAVAVIAGCLELLFLAIYQLLFLRLFVAVTAISPLQLPWMLKYLRAGIWIFVALTVPLFFQAGVGIFSKGSRLEFLEGSRLNLYLVYAGGLVQVAMTPLVAGIINAEKRWPRPVILYLVLVSILSVLLGSKGSALFTLFAIISLLKFEQARDYLRVLLVPIGVAAALFSITVYIVGRFLSLAPTEMVSLMFTRLFLTNDCRALAIDWAGYLSNNSTSVFRESFRLYATLIGHGPQYPPLGQFLYILQFGTVGLAGANTSGTALLIAYGSDTGKVLFSILLVVAAMGLGLLSDLPGRALVLRLAIGINLLSSLSQDFLAFQVSANILVILFIVVLIKSTLTKILGVASATGPDAHRRPMFWRFRVPDRGSVNPSP